MAKFIKITNTADGSSVEYSGLNPAAKLSAFKRAAIKAALSGEAPIPGYTIEIVERAAEKRAYIKKAKNVKIMIDPALLAKVVATAEEEGIHPNAALTVLLEEAIVAHYSAIEA